MTEEPTPLRPCPFCGESSATPVDRGDGDELESVVIVCDVCLAEGPVATIGCRGDEDGDIDLEAEAIELWNQRKFGVVQP